jgi:hypothetical protein
MFKMGILCSICAISISMTLSERNPGVQQKLPIHNFYCMANVTGMWGIYYV